MIFPFFKKIRFLGILGPPGNHASRWIRDLWSKGVSLILAYFKTFLSFCVLDDFFSVFKKIGFWGILGLPSYGIGATICIGRGMLCLPYAEFFLESSDFSEKSTRVIMYHLVYHNTNFSVKVCLFSIFLST